MDFREFCAELEQIIRASGEALEGNCVYYDQTLTEFPELRNKRQNLVDVATANDTPASKIMEIGFNAGHSALLLILNAPNADFTFFDLLPQLETPDNTHAHIVARRTVDAR